jgi:hypothetical protein
VLAATPMRATQGKLSFVAAKERSGGETLTREPQPVPVMQVRNPGLAPPGISGISASPLSPLAFQARKAPAAGDLAAPALQGVRAARWLTDGAHVGVRSGIRGVPPRAHVALWPDQARLPAASLEAPGAVRLRPDLRQPAGGSSGGNPQVDGFAYVRPKEL